MAIGSHEGKDVGSGVIEVNENVDRHRAEDICHNPAGYVRAESAPQIHAPTDRHPTVVLLGTAFVWRRESSG
jgi:hypothetical protein